MAGTTRLQIYNGALELCKSRELASLTEARKPRRLLDRVWAGDGVRYCLEQGTWQFAMRSQEIAHDEDIDTVFGFTYGFTKPDDWVSTEAVCSDPFYRAPMVAAQYADEQEYWYANITPIYVKFVSDDATFGGDMTKWPQSFCDYVYAYFASKICISLTRDKDILAFLVGRPGEMNGGELGKRLRIAKNKAAKTQGTRFAPPGAWNQARYGRGSGNSRSDGGNPGSLIG